MTTTVSVYSAGRLRAPRGAAWAAGAAISIWQTLLLLFAPRASAPTRSAAAEAAAVRELARQFFTTDPSFAADLLAAADRHEGQYDAR